MWYASRLGTRSPGRGTLRYALLVVFVTQVVGQGPVVETPRGPVRGQDEGDYSTYLGIPYAKVDEENPFGVSIPHPKFTEPFEASDSSIKCPQATRGPEGTLQCLRLNIFVPKRQGVEKLPVFLWFHGGGFFFGAAGDYDGRYLVKQNIIVVTANYRLGPYGFFCLNDPKVPGNQGFKDQAEAMIWVRENIGAFGGDPDKVTIAGESYGGGSVDLHLHSNLDKHFDKAVIQSGGAEVEAMFVKPDHQSAIKLAKLFNHTSTSTPDALEFLAKVDPLKLMTTFSSSNILLRACKEKKFKNVRSFLTDDPYHLCNKRKIKDTPVLAGYNSKETFNIIDSPDEFFEANKEIVLDKLNSTFNLKKRDLRKLADIVKEFYLGSKPVSKENVLPIIDFLADFIGTYASENTVTRLVNQGAKVYKYIFSYIGNSPYQNITGVGAIHTEELQYLFLFNNEPELTKPDDIKMRDRMTTLWGNFVKYGNPTPQTTDLLPILWTVVPKESRPYMDIDLTMSMKEDVYHSRVAFWNLIWENYWRRSRIIS